MFLKDYNHSILMLMYLNSSRHFEVIKICQLKILLHWLQNQNLPDNPPQKAKTKTTFTVKIVCVSINYKTSGYCLGVEFWGLN